MDLVQQTKVPLKPIILFYFQNPMEKDWASFANHTNSLEFLIAGGQTQMTYESLDLISIVPTSRTHIQMAKKERVSVAQAGNVDIFLSIQLTKLSSRP